MCVCVRSFGSRVLALAAALVVRAMGRALRVVALVRVCGGDDVCDCANPALVLGARVWRCRVNLNSSCNPKFLHEKVGCRSLSGRAGN